VRGRRLVLLIALAAASWSAAAMCWDEASAKYGVARQLLEAIADVESNKRPEAMNYSHLVRTNSYDIGLMQINSRWLAQLAKYGITEASLRADPCQNLLVGAWILANNVHVYGPTWTAVGAYNAACVKGPGPECDAVRSRYAWRVYERLPGKTSPRASKERNRLTQVAVIAPEAPQRTFLSVRVSE
jgi:soluble lytic murein transglycosylase-like protein